MAELDDDVTRINAQRLESLKWLQANFYDEFAEVYRAVKCRTEPFMVRNSKGHMVEDKTRTNVAMPDIAVAVRRGTARLTANPPQINYTCKDQAVAGKLTAWSYMSFDQSEEAPVQSLHIQQAKTFGISVTKSYWKDDATTHTRRFQRKNLTDRAAMMKLKGNKQPEIDAAVAQLGETVTPEEIQLDIQKNGPELRAKVPVRRYCGPATKFIFIGDYFPEPGFHPHGLKPGWEIEQYIESEQWLKYWQEQTYLDDKGVEQKVFDPVVCKEMLADDTPRVDMTTSQTGQSLRETLFSVSGVSTPSISRDPKLLQGNKRFLVYESHEMFDGEMWIFWVGNEKHLLGKMPYPWDLRGRSCYTQLVLLPDLIMGIGDSTPRLGRFLYRLHNAAVGQRTDLISNILRRPVFVQEREALAEPIERAQFRVYQVKNVNDIKFGQEAEVPSSAWETENQVLKMFGLLDPNLTNMETGTNLNPGVGRTATAATLSQKSSDAMLSYELSGYNAYLRDVCEKKLWMLQQSLEDDIDLPSKYRHASGAASALPASTGAQTEDDDKLTPWEIQENIDVEPEVGSTLAADDEFQRMNAQNLYQLAVSAPEVWNVYEAAKAYAKTLRGIDATKVINAPQPPAKQEPKVTVSVAIKFDDLPAEVKAQLLTGAGIQAPVAEFQAADTLKGVIQTGKAAEAAGKLAEPAVEQPKGVAVGA